MTFDPKAAPADRLKAIIGLVNTLNSDSAPILIGPFRSELGFEASYFQPFVAWMAKQVKDFAKRAHVVTRGGLAPLYGQTASPGIDLYAIRTVTEVRRQNLYDQKQTGLLKQVQQTDWDTRVLEDAVRLLNLGPVFHTVHPAWMYWGFAPYWEDTAGLRHLQAVTDFTPIPKPPMPPGGEALPSVYVAMKFYARGTFPFPDPDVESYVARCAATIAAQVPVVLLGSSNEYDDHSDLPIQGPNIYVVNGGAAHENLLFQAGVLAHAKAFVGTYGGMAQLALRLGVPSVSLWKEFGGTAHAHLSLQSWISKATNVPFAAGSLTDASLWQGTLSLPAPPPTVVASAAVEQAEVTA